jgi:hypothetical protein
MQFLHGWLAHKCKKMHGRTGRRVDGLQRKDGYPRVDRGVKQREAGFYLGPLIAA